MKKNLLTILIAFFGFAYNALAQYCDPTFLNGCFNWNNKEITVDSINWTLGSTDCLFSDYTNMRTTLQKGVPYPMTVLNGAWCGVGVWIDFDNDQEFDSLENMYHMYTAGDPQTYSFLLTIPNTVNDGDYRMRVIAGWGTDCYTPSSNGSGPCGAYEYGNFDDFTIGVTTTGVGIVENDQMQISVYPNPVSDKINIKSGSSLTGEIYLIKDQTGRTVRTGNLIRETTTVSIEDLASGIYMLSIGVDSRKTFKLVKD